MTAKKTTSSSRRASRAPKRAAAAPVKSNPSPALPREKKPVISATTWVTILVLILVAGFAFLFNKQKAAQQAAATPTAGTAKLFASADGQPTDIKIESSQGQSVEVARDPQGAWAIKAPTQAPADQASAQAAATQIGALTVVGNVQLGLDIVGLDKPAYTITITFSGGKTRKLSIGSVNPIQTGYYSQLDGGAVQIIDKQGLDAALTMLTHPPYIATSTPTFTSTPLPVTPTPTEATPAAPVTGTATKKSP